MVCISQWCQHISEALQFWCNTALPQKQNTGRTTCSTAAAAAGCSAASLLPPLHCPAASRGLLSLPLLSLCCCSAVSFCHCRCCRHCHRFCCCHHRWHPALPYHAVCYHHHCCFHCFHCLLFFTAPNSLLAFSTVFPNCGLVTLPPTLLLYPVPALLPFPTHTHLVP